MGDTREQALDKALERLREAALYEGQMALSVGGGAYTVSYGLHKTCFEFDSRPAPPQGHPVLTWGGRWTSKCLSFSCGTLKNGKLMISHYQDLSDPSPAEYWELPPVQNEKLLSFLCEKLDDAGGACESCPVKLECCKETSPRARGCNYVLRQTLGLPEINDE